MSKQKKMIPELRFPEFKNEGEWDNKVLGKICDVRDGTHDSPKYISKGYPLITSKNLLENGDMDFDNVNYLSEDDYNKINERSKVDINDILFGMIGTIGNPVIVKRDGFAIKNVALIKSKGLLNQQYLIQLMKTDYIEKQFQKANAGGILKFIALGMIRKLDIPTPNPKEQQKIASCLSSLDEVIEAHSQKLELLKNHKKGLMQNLFPQDGEKVPKLRFKEFEKDGEWLEKKLGEVGDFIGGGTPDTSIQEYWDGKILWYTPTEVKNGKLKSSIRKITEQGLKNSSAKLLPKGTILITTRATIGDIAITEEECTTNQGFQSLVVNSLEVNLFWLYWILQHKEELIKRASGSTFKEIGKNEITNIPTLSPQKREQQKIASCLSALDELITAQAEKIEQLKQHKKGLMQGLFPKMSESRIL